MPSDPCLCGRTRHRNPVSRVYGILLLCCRIYRAEISYGFKDILHRSRHHPLDEYHARSWRAVMVCPERTLLECGAYAHADLCCGHNRSFWVRGGQADRISYIVYLCKVYQESEWGV